jgi:hypothetical protein
MDQNPSLEANGYSDDQEIPRLFSNPKVHYCVHNSLPQVHILTQMNPFYTSNPISLRSVPIVSSHLPLGLPSSLFPSGFPTKILYAFLISPMRVPVKTAWRNLELRMEETAFRYGGQLGIYWTSSDGQPTRSGPQAWGSAGANNSSP